MLIFLIVILLLAALLEYRSLRGGTACIDGDLSLSKNRVEADEPVALTVTVENNGRMPISYLAVRVGFPLCAALPEEADADQQRSLLLLSEVFRLWGRRSKSRSVSFRIAQRGVHTISGRDISRGDFLGLRNETARFDARRQMLVYPRPLRSSALSEALGNYCGEMSAQRWLLRDPVLTLGVREYTGNEPMHTISWSQTARRGELTVREFDYTRSLNCCVLLCVNGLSAEDTALLDRCCSAARTVCETLIAAGVEAALFTNAALVGYLNEPMRTATASLGRQKDVLDILARATSAACSGAAEFARAALEAQAGPAAFVLIAPHMDAAALEAQRILDAGGGMGTLLLAADALEES